MAVLVQVGDVVRSLLMPQFTWTVESVADDCVGLIRWDKETESYVSGVSTVGGLVVVKETVT